MNRINVLVAEDEPLIRQNTVKKIRNIGEPYNIIGEAEDGEEAIEMASNLFADILITDIRMPERDGLSVAKYLKKTYPAIQIIIITGYDDFAYAREAIRCEVIDFLVKPITQDDLQSALNRAKEQIEWEFGSIDAQVRRTTEGKRSIESLINLMTHYIVDECCNHELTVAHLAETFGYSSDHITRLFFEHLKTTPSEYIRKMRIRASVRLLREHPQTPINKISEQSGYKDPGHFSRIIKSQTGMTPSEIRNGKV